MAAVLQTVEPHPASVEAYIRAGWSLVPIPPGSKGPRTVGWNRRDGGLRSQTDLPPGWGIGLAHAYSGTMALDIDDYDAAVLILPDLDALFAAPDAVTIDSGNPGHGKLLYSMPFGLRLPTKKVTAAGKVVYELRCATADDLTTQDVLPPSTHPGTGQSYRWGGRGDWQHLPLLPVPLLTLWQSLLTEPPAPEQREPTGTVDWTEVRSAVNAIDPDCSREEWIQAGMVLHKESPEGGLQVWQEWSQRGKKYPGDRGIAAQWRSFRDDKANSVGLGTLYKIAADHGWQRPAPDVAVLFKPITVTPEVFRTSVRSPPPAMDFDLWPPVLRERALKLAKATSCNPLVPLWAGLAAAAGATDARSRIKLMEGWEMPPVLWLMTVGEPAQRKTPGSTPMKAALVDIEREDRPRFAKAMQVWEMRNAIYTAKKKEILDWAKSEDCRLGGTEPETQDDNGPVPPTPLRIVVTDVTSQKLVRLAAGLPQGLVCWLDEMNSWCDKLTDKASGEQRSTWTVAYDSQEYRLDRAGDGTIIADNYALSIYGNIQPTVFRQHIKSLSADGFIQRFVPAVLGGGGGPRELNEPMPDDESGRVQWENALRCIHALPPQTYTLDAGAHAAFREFQRWLNQKTWDDTLLNRGGTYLTAMGKLDGTVGRFALVMHLLESPFSTVVSEDTMRRAIAVGQTYITPVLRFVFGEMSGESQIDAWVADYVVQHADRVEITMGEIKRSGRRQFDEIPSPWAQDQAVLGAMLPLEVAGWVTRADDGTQEQRHVARWAVNPEMRGAFAGYRSALIAARQRDYDEMQKYRDDGRTRRTVHGFKPG